MSKSHAQKVLEELKNMKKTFVNVDYGSWLTRFEQAVAEDTVEAEKRRWPLSAYISVSQLEVKQCADADDVRSMLRNKALFAVSLLEASLRDSGDIKDPWIPWL